MFHIILNLNLQLQQNQEGLFSQVRAVAQNSCSAQGMTVREEGTLGKSRCSLCHYVVSNAETS